MLLRMLKRKMFLALLGVAILAGAVYWCYVLKWKGSGSMSGATYVQDFLRERGGGVV